MTVRRLCALFCFLFSTAFAQAQLGLYGNVAGVRYNDQNQNTTTWFVGPGGGLYYNFVHLGPIALGADVRGNYLFADKQEFRSGLAGLRLAVKPPLLPIRPYIQGSVGVGGVKYTGPSSLPENFSNKFEYQVLGGLDFTILPHIDLRLAEAGYGHISGVGSGPSTPDSTVLTLGAGLVIRLF